MMFVAAMFVYTCGVFAIGIWLGYRERDLMESLRTWVNDRKDSHE